MHLHFERNVNSKCDCPILSLTWMGKVPDELPEVCWFIFFLVFWNVFNCFVLCVFQDEGWKLNRTNYYQEGWLATGNVRGIVGVTFTTSHCKKTVDYPIRTNYNLRGHRSEVSAKRGKGSLIHSFSPLPFFCVRGGNSQWCFPLTLILRLFITSCLNGGLLAPKRLRPGRAHTCCCHGFAIVWLFDLRMGGKLSLWKFPVCVINCFSELMRKWAFMSGGVFLCWFFYAVVKLRIG